MGGEFMQENDLYPHVESFLCENKDCLGDYIGNELPFGSFRPDVFGVSVKDNGEKMVYLLEGKLWIDNRDIFSKVISETSYLNNYADFIYIFGKIKKAENFPKSIEECKDRKMVICSLIEECKGKGIGILIIDDNNQVHEFLKAEKRTINSLCRKEAIFRIFNKIRSKDDGNTPIADFILQATYEYTEKTSERCAKYIEIYNALFSNDKYKGLLRRLLGGKHVLNEIGMRKAFQKNYGGTYFIGITPGKTVTEDLLCVNEKTLSKTKPPILLD